MSSKTNKIVAALESATLEEILEAKKAIQEMFGIDDAMLAGGGSAPAAAESAGSTASEFTVKITEVGNKIEAIKGLMKIEGFGLGDSKKKIDEIMAGTPFCNDKVYSKEAANEYIKKLADLSAAGFKTELVAEE